MYLPPCYSDNYFTCYQIRDPGADDPLIAQTNDYRNESKLIQDCDDGLQAEEQVRVKETISSFGRQDTDCSLWMAMQFVDIDSKVRQKSQ